jgi:deoxyadenosine/deoxycytidine kinase
MSHFSCATLERRVVHWFSLHGSIGAGKSTVEEAVVDELHKRGLLASEASGDVKRPLYVPVEEPIGPWSEKKYTLEKQTTPQGNSPNEMATSTDGLSAEQPELYSMVDLFYSDIALYASDFQTMAFTSRLNEVFGALDGAGGDSSETPLILFTDRDMFADEMFMENLYVNGQVKQWQYDAYCGLYERTAKPMREHVSVMLYLPTSPERCLERIIKRNRPGEAGRVSLEYLKQLRDAHHRMMSRFTGKIIVLKEFADELTADEIVQYAQKLVDQMESIVATQ